MSESRNKPQPPERLLKGVRGERDERGFLVTHVVHRDPDGKPMMKLVNTSKAESCMLERRCQACGSGIRHTEWIGFIGSVGSTSFKEAPIHLDCAFYSFASCPHLLRETRGGSIEIALCRRYRCLEPGEGPEASPEHGVRHCVPCALEAEEDLAEVSRLLPEEA